MATLSLHATHGCTATGAGRPSWRVSQAWGSGYGGLCWYQRSLVLLLICECLVGWAVAFVHCMRSAMPYTARGNDKPAFQCQGCVVMCMRVCVRDCSHPFTHQYTLGAWVCCWGSGMSLHWLLGLCTALFVREHTRNMYTTRTHTGLLLQACYVRLCTRGGVEPSTELFGPALLGGFQCRRGCGGCWLTALTVDRHCCNK